MTRAVPIVPATPAAASGIGPSPAVPPAAPVRLLAPASDVANPFAPGREVSFARVAGSLLEGAGVRDGDHVALLRPGPSPAREVEHGDLAAVAGSDGRAALWKVYPEGDGLRLSTGPAAAGVSLSRRAAPGARVTGVVVAVLRKFRDLRDLRDLRDR